jgi:hypothetical protein
MVGERTGMLSSLRIESSEQITEEPAKEQTAAPLTDELVLSAFKEAMGHRIFRLMELASDQTGDSGRGKLPSHFWTGDGSAS